MNFLYPLQQLTLLALLLLSLVPCPGAAQTTRDYADRVVSSLNTTNPTSATGHTPTTQATLSPSPLAGTAALRLGFSNLNPAGSKAGLVVNSGGLLTLAALNGLVINTYLTPSTTPQETIQLSQLLTLQVANGGPAAAEFTSAKPFDQLELSTGGLLNAYSLGLVEAYADRAAPLPVELVAFQGKATAAGAQLNWQTASEFRNDYFAIERATDRGTKFIEVGRVAGGAINSLGHHYQFIDTQPSPVAYYRLRQVDLDGQVHYSPLVVVQQQVVTETAGLAAYPNPASATLVVACSSGAHFSLLNYQGQLVEQITLAAGQHRLDISHLLAGIYYLCDTVTGQRTRFIKVNDQ